METKRDKVVFIHSNTSAGRSLVRIARSAGLEAELYVSIAAFLTESLLIDAQRTSVGVAVLQLSLCEDKTFRLLRESKGVYRPLLPVILLSSSDNEKVRCWARDLGACGLFQEPADGEALLDAIRWQLCISGTKNDGRIAKQNPAF